MFQLLGLDAKAAKAAADNAFRVETALAKLQQDEVARRDPHAVYHRVDRAGPRPKVAPRFPWDDYLAALEHRRGHRDHGQRSEVLHRASRSCIATEKPAALRDYLTWTVLRETRDDLGKAWVDEAFTMQKELAGVKELPPRWRRCVHHVDDDLGELLGQSYVKARFAGDSKARAVDLTKSVLGAMRVELDTLPWMDDATRGAGEAEARQDGVPRRLPRQVAHVRLRDRRAPTSPANVRGATKWELARQLAQDRQAGRSLRLADDAADGQRLLRPVAQRDRAARRPAPAAVLRRARSTRRSTSARPAAARSATR